jgi:hypothetical protein
MTATDKFYGTDVFVEEVDFTVVDPQEPLTPLQQGRVEITSRWLGVAAIAFVGMLTLVTSSVAASVTATTVTSDRSPTTAPPTATSMPRIHLQKSNRAKRMFASVPLNEVEQLPDPDYGL